MFKNFIYLFAIAGFLLGSIGGTGYLFYDGHILFGVANIILSLIALGSVIDMFKNSQKR